MFKTVLKMLKTMPKNGLFRWYLTVEKLNLSKIGAVFNNLHRVFNNL